MILIIGSQEEYHSKFIYELLKSKGEDVCYFDSRQIPGNINLAWIASNNENDGYLNLENKKIPFETIKSVYWRWYYGIEVKPLTKKPEEALLASMFERENISAIESIFSSLNCLWINSIEAIKMHEKKSYQLNLMAKNGIRVPKTLITNDKDALPEFFEQNHGQLIFKPVRGGAHTSKVKKEDLTEKRLDSLINSPVQFQEFIDGIDIRVYVIGDDIFSAEIRANTLDFREDTKAQIVPIELPDPIKDDCRKVMELLKLKFSGIDIRRSKKGEYVFIEANPSPMFTYFEQKSGFPISKALTDLLIKG